MTDIKKELNDKAIDIKGKKYVLVSDRILAFNEEYKNGMITTDLISSPSDNMVIIKATVHPDADSGRFFTGYSQATWGDGMVNKTSAMENAETSAVGRALAMMGIGVIDSVASVDEINKTTHPRVITPMEGGTISRPIESTPACPEHGVEYQRYEKNGKVWYSHKLADGTYCNKK